MGFNKTAKKKTKNKKRIPKKELDHIHELKIENAELKREIKALQRFIRRIKSTKKVTITPATPKKKKVKIPSCPECDGPLKDLKITRPDGSFKITACTLCKYRTPMTKTK